MKMNFRNLAIAAAVALSFGSAQAAPNCKKISVQKNVEATISLSLNCTDQLKAAFPGFTDQYLNLPLPDGSLANVCYLSPSDPKIPAKIGGRPVELETVSALLQGGTQNSQLVVTLYRISGAYNGELYAIDNIHGLDGYEDEMFIGGTGDFTEAGGIGRLSFTVDSSSGLPFPDRITFTRLKGDVCFGKAG